MIKKTSLHQLNNDELNTLVKRLIALVQSFSEINIGIIAKILLLITKLNTQLTTSLNTSFKGEHSELLKKLDNKRDNAYRALRDFILACTRRLNDSCRMHAAKLITVIRTHGWSLWDENYQEESSKLNSLIADFEQTDKQTALSELRMTDWYTEMKGAQSEFEQAFLEKANDKTRENYITLAEIRPKLINTVNDLLERIDSDFEYSDTPELYTDLIFALNNTLEETSKLAKARITRQENEANETDMEEES